MNCNTNTPPNATKKATLHKPAPVVIVPVEMLSADCEKYGITDDSANRKRIRRGYAIFESAFSANPHIQRNGETEQGHQMYTVTSQNPKAAGEKYIVILSPEAPTCTCPDMMLPPHAEQCKHITAALMLREFDADREMIAYYEEILDSAETGPNGFGCEPHDHAKGFGF